MTDVPEGGSPRRPMIAVVGGARAPEEVLAAAEAVGRALVDAGWRIVTGGLGGVMAAASRGGRMAPGWFEGAVIGLLPGIDPVAANPWVDVVIPTGMGHARNVLVVSSAAVVVAIGGGAGTLSEVALAWAHGRAVIGLQIGEGWSHRLVGEVLDDRSNEPIAGASNPAEVVARVRELLAAPPRRDPGRW